jgi:hypothetical protein
MIWCRAHSCYRPGPAHSVRPAIKMITVLKIPVAKDRLRAMPADERALLILLGHAANQINLLSKLVIFSSNKDPDGVEQFLSAAQTQLLARFAIGVLNEGWELISRQFLATPIGKTYSAKLDAGGQVALAALKKSFGGSNIINQIRKNYAFHHPYTSDVNAAFEVAADSPGWDAEWNWYFSHSGYNSFYFLSDFVIMHGILNAVGETDLVVAQEKIMTEVRSVSENMSQFIMALTAAFWLEHFGAEMTGEVCAKITNAPGAFDVWIPFFMEIPEAPPADRA